MGAKLNKLQLAQEERRARAKLAGQGGNYFRVAEDGEETFRLLETLDEIYGTSAFFHELPALKKKAPPRLEICLDQDENGARTGEECPGCDLNAEDYQDAKRKLVMYANVIWRNATVREKNDKNQYVDTDEKKDQLAIWEIRQSTIQDALSNAEMTYKDLTTRDFVIRRSGTGYDTSYSIQPWTDDEGETKKTPLSAEDKELAEKKKDLTSRIEKKEIKDWGKVAKKKDDDDDGDEADSESPFLKKQRDKS
jgi:hypothetical protein